MEQRFDEVFGLIESQQSVLPRSHLDGQPLKHWKTEIMRANVTTQLAFGSLSSLAKEGQSWKSFAIKTIDDVVVFFIQAGKCLVICDVTDLSPSAALIGMRDQILLYTKQSCCNCLPLVF